MKLYLYNKNNLEQFMVVYGEVEGGNSVWLDEGGVMHLPAFIEDGTAFVRVNGYSDLAFLDELTESGIYSLTVTVNKGFLATNTGKGTDMRVRAY